VNSRANLLRQEIATQVVIAAASLCCVQYPQDDNLLLLDFINRNKRERRQNEFASVLDTTKPTTIGECAETADRFRDVVSNAMGSSKAVAGDVVANLLEIVGYIPWSSGLASPAISLIHSSSNVIVLEQLPFTRSGSPLFDLGTEPLVVVYRTGQQVKRNLVD
jgi:hypothetical protein